MKLKKYLFAAIALAFGAFALVSCEKGNDDLQKEKERQEEKEKEKEKEKEQEELDAFLPITDQQTLLASSALKTAQKIDFSKLAPLATVADSIVVKGLAPLTEVISEILENQDFQGKYAIILRMLKAEVLNLDLKDAYVKVEVDIVDSIYNREPMLVMANPRVDPDNNCVELVMNYEGHKCDIKLNILDTNADNVITMLYDGEKDPNGDYPNTFNIPEALSLEILFDEETILSYYSLLDTDLKGEFKLYGDSLDWNSIKATCSKFSWGGKFTFDDFAATVTATYKEREGLEVTFSTSIAEENLLSGEVMLNASLESIVAFDLPSLMGWAISPQNLRSLSGSMKLGTDVKIDASLKHPMTCPFVIETIGGLFASEDAVLTEEVNKMLIDSLNSLFSLDVYFAGYDKPQAKMQFMYYDVNFDKNAFIEANPIITNNKLAELLKGKINEALVDKIISALNRANVVPAIVAKDADGNEVYMRLDQYLDKIDLKTPFGTIVGKFSEMLATFASDLANMMAKG